jgi:5'-nucleotidase
MHPELTQVRPRLPRGGARLFAVLASLALVLTALTGTTFAGGSAQGIAARSVSLQLLAINDFHGNLEPPSGSGGRIVSDGVTTDAGGVEYLATHIRALEATNPNTLVVSAGDNIGASPLISGFFHDEPAIEALNALGLDVSSVGNHEFDEGAAELMRMQNGGCHPVDGCFGGDGFAGAAFPFLSANVVVTATGQTLFPAYTIKKLHGVRVGFIGLTLEGTPTIVTPSGVAGLTFLDEVETINHYTQVLQAQHVETIIVLLHEGGIQSVPTGQNVSVDGCVGLTGPIVNIVNGLDSAVDVVLSGHTHQFYNCAIENEDHSLLLTSASSFGRLVTDIDLQIDRATKDVVSMSADNVIVDRTVAKDAAETAVVTKYKALSDAISQQVVGSIGAPEITRTQNSAGESALGDVIADAQLEAMDNEFGAQVAFMNPGGIRADITCGVGESLPCSITFGELFTVQPFANDMVAFDITGAQIDTMLEQQFDNPVAGDKRILQVSSNFSYQWDASNPAGSKVDPSTIMLNGVVINPATTYRIATNIFLAGGGDRFFVLASGTNRVVGPIDLDALVAYFGAHSPVASPPLNRIVMVP